MFVSKSNSWDKQLAFDLFGYFFITFVTINFIPGINE